jgi:hypothetical protein
LVHGNHKKKHKKKRESMPSSCAKMVDAMSYDTVRTAPFTGIHGCLMRHDYKTLKKEPSNLASKVDNLTFAWSQDPTTGEEYGLLAEIIGNVEYTHLTNLIWIQELEPQRYYPAITNATATNIRKRMQDKWEEKHESWYICKGFLCGVMMKLRNALDEQYFSQLKHVNTAYCNTTPIQILEHLDTRCCPLDIHACKILKKELYADWDSSDTHITAFGIKLDKKQSRLDRLGIVISDES